LVEKKEGESRSGGRSWRVLQCQRETGHQSVWDSARNHLASRFPSPLGHRSIAAAAATPTTNGSEAAGSAYQLRTRSSSLRTARVEAEEEEEEEKKTTALSTDSEGKRLHLC
jgi:hypothetical protein